MVGSAPVRDCARCAACGPRLSWVQGRLKRVGRKDVQPATSTPTIPKSPRAGNPSFLAVLLTPWPATLAPYSTALATTSTPRFAAASTLVATDEAALASELATSDGPAVLAAVVAASKMAATRFRLFAIMITPTVSGTGFPKRRSVARVPGTADG